MFGTLILLGLILAVAGLGALVIHMLKRRTDREFAVIGVTNDRRSTELQKRGDNLERARADAVFDRWTTERAAVRARMRLISADEPDYRMPEVFREQAG